jgi:hypothetical protein
MTGRGPERNEPVEVLRDGVPVASATCFLATFEADGERRWRGFLANIEPSGAVIPGTHTIRLASGVTAEIEVREVHAEPREQAVFTGRGAPPP